MKAISLWQPWASAMALGLKRIETRHWSTRYRGPIAIHAAKRWTAEEREILDAQQGLFWPTDAHGRLIVPLGAIVATARLVDIRSTEQLIDGIDAVEARWGNYGPGRFGWLFQNIVPLEAPIPFRGAQGLFDVPDALLTPSGSGAAADAVAPQGELL